MIIKNNSYSLMNWVFEGEAVSLKIIGFKEIKNKDFWFRFNVYHSFDEESERVVKLILDVELEDLNFPPPSTFLIRKLLRMTVILDMLIKPMKMDISMFT